MLQKIIEAAGSGQRRDRPVPANAWDDDIEIYTDERSQVALTWYGLRQQTEKPVVDGVMRPSRCLADFVAPKTAAADYVGLFAVTAGLGVEKKEQAFDRTTTTRPSCSRPWPTAWPRPLPNACTSACAPTCGAAADEALSNES
jgi:5-methyltetrahydrofolate--homocysteine methyltransferase